MRFVLEVGRGGLHAFRERRLESLLAQEVRREDAVPYERARLEAFALALSAAERARMRMALESLRALLGDEVETDPVGVVAAAREVIAAGLADVTHG